MSQHRTRSQPPNHTTHLVKNKSSRLGSPIQAIAVHSTESADIPNSRDDLVGVRNWFDNPQSQASAHVGIDGDGHSEIWVHGEDKAWTILQLNNRTLNIEFVARAAQAGSAWEEEQIKKGAQWVAWWAIKYDLPIQRGNVKDMNNYPVITRKGVITHKQLTDAGFGTHQDPGPNFPMDDLLKSARWYKKNGWIVND